MYLLLNNHLVSIDSQAQYFKIGNNDMVSSYRSGIGNHINSMVNLSHRWQLIHLFRKYIFEVYHKCFHSLGDKCIVLSLIFNFIQMYQEYLKKNFYHIFSFVNEKA
jgi:hypothetical protein